MSEGDDSKQGGGGSEQLGYVEPDYDIGDVRRALRELLQELRTQQAQKGAVDEATLNAAYSGVLTTLSRVASNLLPSPPNPAHLRINLRSAPVLSKFGAYAGARALLRFLGFQERVSVESHSLEVEAAALPGLRVRIERAIVLLAKVREEHAPQPQPQQSEREEMVDVVGGSAMEESSGDSVVAAPSSVFLANAEGDEEGAFRSPSPSPPPDEEMRPDLAPSYVIGDVRAALNQLYSEVEAAMPLPVAAAAAASSQSGSDVAPARATPFQLHLHRLGVRDAYCAVLDTLAKVTGNLLRAPPNPAHLRINLANATVHKRFAQFPGALLFLRFLGFKEHVDATADADAQPADAATSPSAAAPVTPSSASGESQSQQQLLVLPESDLARDPVKISRALTILQKARSDAAPTPAENEQRTLGPVDRALRLFDLNVLAAEPARAAPAGLRSPAEDDSDAGRADLALLMAAAAAERKRVHELSRTDVIVTKQQQAEIKEAFKRRYHSTLVKVTFTDKSAVQAPQGQGRYGLGEGGSSRTASGGYRLGLKANYGVPAVSPPAANVPGGPEPMDEDGDEKQGAPLPVAQPVAMSVSPAAAAASVTVSPPPAPAAAPAAPVAPAAEVMLSAYFRPWETLGDLFAFLQSQLSESSRGRPFYLHLPPSVKFQCGGEDKQGRHAEAARKSLQSLGLVPAAAMIFHYCADAAPNASPAAASASASSPAPAAAASGVVSTLRPELLARREPYDAHALASLIPVAENKDQLEAQKAKLLADAKGAGGGGAGSKHGASSSSASASGSGSLSLGAHGSDDDDLDMEAYMRAKKKAAITGKSGLAGRSGGAASGSSSSGSSGSSASAGSAASKRNIPGLFSQLHTHAHAR